MTCFNFLWQVDKVIVVFPMRFNDSVDTILATSFLQVWNFTFEIYGPNISPQLDNCLSLFS